MIKILKIKGDQKGALEYSLNKFLQREAVLVELIREANRLPLDDYQAWIYWRAKCKANGVEL